MSIKELETRNRERALAMKSDWMIESRERSRNYRIRAEICSFLAAAITMIAGMCLILAVYYLKYNA